MVMRFVAILDCWKTSQEIFSAKKAKKRNHSGSHLGVNNLHYTSAIMFSDEAQEAVEFHSSWKTERYFVGCISWREIKLKLI